MQSSTMEIFSHPEDAASFITVSDPVQHAEGMNKYTSYRVDVRPPPPPQGEEGSNNHQEDVFHGAVHTAVLRRYSDFAWLYDRLHKERPGAIIPAIPEKKVARFSSSFIEDRRVNLERFLRRVAVHPELYDAPSLDTFLRADDLTFQTAKNIKGSANDMMMSMSLSSPYPSSNMNAPTPPKKDGIKKWFAETKTSIARELVRSPDDDLFLEIERYIDGLEKQMKNVQQHASALVKKGKEIANGLFEFGLAFNILGQSEADALGKALMNMGSAADQLSSVSMLHAEREMAQFEEPLKDYLKTIHAVKLALQRRHEKRLTYTTYLTEVNTKRMNLAKFRATPGSEAKAYGAELSLQRGEQAAEIARNEFATVSQRVLREVDRFKREKGEEMRHVILQYINLQIAYNKEMEKVWEDLLPKLEAVQLNSSQDKTSENTIKTTYEGKNDESNSEIHQDSSLYHDSMHQNMLGLEESVQYRDDSGYPIS